MSFRDRTGRQAMKRGNRFTDLEKQVQQMEEENIAAMGGMLDQFIEWEQHIFHSLVELQHSEQEENI